MPDTKPPIWSRCLAGVLASALAATACHRAPDTGDLIDEARAYRGRGDQAAAVIQLKNALVHDSRNAEARRLLGEIHIEQGDGAAAENELRRALELGAPPDLLQPLLARSWLMQQQFERLLAETDPAGSPPILALRGDAQLYLGRTREARTTYAGALERDPACAPALLGLARLALAEEHAAEARDLVGRALAAAPFDVDALRLEGDLLRLDGRQDAALVAYRKILSLRPNHPQALIDIANVHIDAGDFAQARKDIALARRSSPGALAVYHAQAFLDYREKRFRNALDGVQQILGVAPGHMPSILLAGAIESAMGANEQAARHFRQFLEKQPGHLYASKALAVTHLREKQPEKAVELLAPLLRTHADDVELLTLAGEAQLRANRFDEAAALFESASALRPDAPLLHAGVAMGRLGTGDTGRAVAELEHALSLDRSSQRTALMLVMARLRAGQPDKALAAVQDMARQGDSAIVQNLEGGVHLALHDSARARACFERALQLDAAYLPALDNLAQLDRLEKRGDDARKRYERALAISPSNLPAMIAFARYLAANRDMAGAIAWLEKAHQLKPDAPAPALRLAEIYARAGHPQQALLLARQLQASRPGDPDALSVLALAQYGDHDLKAAAASYTRLSQLLPSRAAAPYRLALIALQLNDRPAAMAALRTALAREPDLFDAQITLVNLLVEAKKFGDAAGFARDVQRRHPDGAAGYKLEGDVLGAQGRSMAALAAYEHAFRLAPSGALLAQLHQLQQGSGAGAQADARLRQWLAGHPDDLPTHLYFASAKLVAKDYPAAIEQLEAVLRIEPANVVALNDLAWASQHDAPRNALAYAERAHHLAPESAAVTDTLGWILLENGKLPRALPLLRKASAMARESPEIRYHLGVALARSGDRQGARREIEQALALPYPFASRDQARAVLATL
jgi:putative PEP-CTERM system TPR-repeat lipoprotein